MSIPQINASIIGNEMQQNTLQKELRELDNQIAQQRSFFIQLLNVYYNTVEDWKQKYLVIAPLEGNLVYAGFPEEKQQLQINAVIGYITMNDKRSFAEMLIPQRNFGKVKIGQQVLLKFQSYPYQEFGTVKGVIENIKSLPTDSGYLSRIILPDGLTTNHHKTLNFTEGMTATAEIITNNQRLSDRFIGKIKDLIK
jgi:HlyD family secretion protein